MMEQYQGMQQSLPAGVLLMFRLGDFYEMFFDDAAKAAGILNLTLTQRGGIPMCGIPHHALEAYLPRLVASGLRVALAEQVSQPQAGKLVERRIARIISQATYIDENKPGAFSNNFLVAVCKQGSAYGLACVDYSTAEFSLAQFANQQALDDEISALQPSEILVSEKQSALFAAHERLQPYDDYAFVANLSEKLLLKHFKVHNLDGFGCAGMTAAVAAAGAVLHYLQNELRQDTAHLNTLKLRNQHNVLSLDKATQRNLDLIDARAGSQYSLYAALNRTQTAMGARLLKDWLLHPSRDLQLLQQRQDFIEQLLHRHELDADVNQALSKVRDIERLSVRLAQGGGNARDLQTLAFSLANLPELKSCLQQLGKYVHLAGELEQKLGDFSALVSLLASALVDEPPVAIKEGGMFKQGYSPELDRILEAAGKGKSWLVELQQQQRELSGIDNLKIGYNNVFGYYIEVSKSKLDRVPEHYQRRQTLANAERFITPELKAMEATILGADERACHWEYEEFCRLRTLVAERLADLQACAAGIAVVDVLSSLCQVARQYNYVRPLLKQGGCINLQAARHPVIEQHLQGEVFVANDLYLERDEARLLLITGPNMAGKSTYIRQAALLVLMAQIGSFVPAASAEIGLVDKIFCRVGASDDLSRGQSTFMVEMAETALIVNNATADSLVILDEIGRGTATFDGLAIAWSVAEHLHDKIAALCLFATHYHELTELENQCRGVKNFNVAVREIDDEIIFLRQIVAGKADRSYGIQVARLAGLPPSIIKRSKQILQRLERHAKSPMGSTREPRSALADLPARQHQGQTYFDLEIE